MIYWQTDNVILHHGDSALVLAELPEESIDLTVTSPPYDNLRLYNGFTFDFETIARELYRVTKPGGVVVWVVGDATVNGSETGTSFRQALYFKDVCVFALWDTMIYSKASQPHQCGMRYEQQFEYMFILSKGEPIARNLRGIFNDCQASYRACATANSTGLIERTMPIENTNQAILPEYFAKQFFGWKSLFAQQQSSWTPRQFAVEPFVPINEGERRILYALENMNRVPIYPPRILLLPSTFLRLCGGRDI